MAEPPAELVQIELGEGSIRRVLEQKFELLLRRMSAAKTRRDLRYYALDVSINTLVDIMEETKGSGTSVSISPFPHCKESH